MPFSRQFGWHLQPDSVVTGAQKSVKERPSTAVGAVAAQETQQVYHAGVLASKYKSIYYIRQNKVAIRTVLTDRPDWPCDMALSTITTII